MGEFARASDELMQEHRLIERVLDALETATRHFENGHPVRAEWLAPFSACSRAPKRIRRPPTVCRWQPGTPPLSIRFQQPSAQRRLRRRD
jgi:hypothetical protein